MNGTSLAKYVVPSHLISALKQQLNSLNEILLKTTKQPQEAALAAKCSIKKFEVDLGSNTNEFPNQLLFK